MAGDYLPRTDEGFDSWFTTFVGYCNANAAALGLAAARGSRVI
ncbi:MAG TPA: hypothetical protein VIL86_12405 [Tepidisphaeraceae bacterium]